MGVKMGCNESEVVKLLNELKTEMNEKFKKIDEKIDEMNNKFFILNNEMSVMKRVNNLILDQRIDFNIKKPLQTVASTSFLGDLEEINSIYKL